MTRLPFADPETEGNKPLAAQIALERGSVLDLYQMPLHSPPVATGWLRHLTAIRHECMIPGQVRELVIMRVALLNGASYEAEQHASFALKEGLSHAQLGQLHDWVNSSLFDERQRAVLAYTDAMTRDIRVANHVFQAVQKHFNSRLVVELTATIAAYNMVSRFLEALEIHAVSS
jgi:alkylhydroperoxidase family enzyme